MSVAEEPKNQTGCGIVSLILAAIGSVAVLVLVGAGVALTASSTGQDCLAAGQSRLVCGAGAIGLVDLAALDEKDKRITTLTDEVAAKATEAGEAVKRAEELAARVTELDTALAGAKTTAAAADQLRGEIAKRDARIAELTEKAAAARKPEVVPVPTARPKTPAAPKP